MFFEFLTLLSDTIKLKVLYNRYRVTEWTEVNAMLRRCSVQILDNFWDKCFGHKVTKKVCKQAPSLYAPTVPP